MRRELILIGVLIDFIGLTHCQRVQGVNCTVDLQIEPRPVNIGKTKTMKVICKSSLNLRLILNQNPTMYIEKYTPRGPVVVATLYGNDTTEVYERGVKVIGFFPTNFQIIYTKPTCEDVTSYRCSVNVSNTRVCSLKTSANTQILGSDGPPRLTISPKRNIYRPGQVVSLTCSSSFFNLRKVFSWNWFHPIGKQFPEIRVQGQIRAGKTCNRTSKVTFTLDADDNGAIVVCMTELNGVKSLEIRVAEEAASTTVAGRTDPTSMFDISDPVDCVPAYSLALVAILMVIFSLTLYTVILIAGGSQLKLPFRKCIATKDRTYAVPDRAAATAEDENRYYSLKRNLPDYANSEYVNRTYEDIEN